MTNTALQAIVEKFQLDDPQQQDSTKADGLLTELFPYVEQLVKKQRYTSTFGNSAVGFDVDDLVQETLFRLVRLYKSPDRKLPKLSTGAALSGFIHRVAYNVAVDQFKANSSRANGDNSSTLSSDTGADQGSNLLLKSTIPTPYDVAAGSSFARAVGRIVGKITPVYADALCLSLEGLPYTAIAERLGVPKGTVCTRLHRGRAQFQKLFIESRVSDEYPLQHILSPKKLEEHTPKAYQAA